MVSIMRARDITRDVGRRFHSEVQNEMSAGLILLFYIYILRNSIFDICWETEMKDEQNPT